MLFLRRELVRKGIRIEIFLFHLICIANFFKD